MFDTSLKQLLEKGGAQGNGAHAEPSKMVLVEEKELLELKHNAGYWRSLHERSIKREGKLKKVILGQKALIRDLRNRVFGKKSEKKGSVKDKGNPKPKNPPRPRGQQKGSKGHGRTRHDDLPKKIERHPLPSESDKCPKCGKAYSPHGSEDVEIIEVEVKAYKRVIKRCRGKQDCTCEGVPKTIIAPTVPRILPRNPYGISIWMQVLLNKFLYSQPTNRLLESYNELELRISPGTITDGLKKLVPMLAPVYETLFERQMTEDRFHNDESGWKVFEAIDGKIGNRWWLWVSRSSSVVFFQIAPGRGADVPVTHFFANQHDKIIVVCDRFSAYKSMAKQLDFIVLAFCWAHVRRDFLDTARSFPNLEGWAMTWVEMIAEIYHINNQRCTLFDKNQPLNDQSHGFHKLHSKLQGTMAQMHEKFTTFINEHIGDVKNKPENAVHHTAKLKVLSSLNNHWEGLNVFVEHPDVLMDNNNAERSIRNPVTGRKNYYGSGSVWSSELAAIMFSIFQTLKLWGINCTHWLEVYLTACADNNSQSPENLKSFLPWEMDEQRLQALSKAPDTS